MQTQNLITGPAAPTGGAPLGAIEQFDDKWGDRLRAAARVDSRDYRADSLTPTAMGWLNQIDPVLAFHIATGNLRMAQMHRDSSESLFFARQLEYIRPGLLEVLFPDLELKKWVPMETNIGAGAEEYTYRYMRKVGRAQLIKQYSDDPPRADVVGGETVQKIRGMADSYGYTMQELRAAMQAQLPLDVRKAMSARYAISLLHDEIWMYGHADINAEQSATGNDAGALEAGLKGLATLASTTAFTTPNGGAGSALWRKKTPDEMVTDLHGVVNNVVKSTFGIHRPDQLILPLAAYNMASTRRMGDGSNQTVLDFFLATSPYCKAVDPSYRLDQAQSANWNGTSSPTTGRAVAYERNPERLAALMPLEFEQLAPEQRVFEIRTACHARTGGVIAFYPGSISYMDGITDGSD
jgi:hypothetical protein